MGSPANSIGRANTSGQGDTPRNDGRGQGHVASAHPKPAIGGAQGRGQHMLVVWYTSSNLRT